MPSHDTPPMDRDSNCAAVVHKFAHMFDRPPLPPGHPDALINDLIFARMIEPAWSAQERALVDKATAKAAAAQLCPGLRCPQTLATIAMDTVDSPVALHERLIPFIGMDAIAKPAQASGGTVFLRDGPTEADVARLHDLATRDYALVMREMQYAGLPRNVIVEAVIPTRDGRPPDDYKFQCIHGEPLLCQVDHARFAARWSRVLRLPDLAPLDPADGFTPPQGLWLPSPGRIAEMIAIARALSAPFAYARIDLYDGLDGVYFGEVTFTPAASLGIAPSAAGCHRVSKTHRLYSDTLMAAYRKMPATLTK